MSNNKNVEVTRTFNAPVQVVWNAWVESDLVKQWWGPTGFTCPVADMDVKEGGVSLVCMRAPKEYGGMEIFNNWKYTKVVPGERLEYIVSFADKNGDDIDPSTAGIPTGIPNDVPHTVTFKAVGNKTEVTILEEGYPSDEAAALSKTGQDQCMDKMATLFAA